VLTYSRKRLFKHVSLWLTVTTFATVGVWAYPNAVAATGVKVLNDTDYGIIIKMDGFYIGAFSNYYKGGRMDVVANVLPHCNETVDLDFRWKKKRRVRNVSMEITSQKMEELAGDVSIQLHDVDIIKNGHIQFFKRKIELLDAVWLEIEITKDWQGRPYIKVNAI